MLLPDKLHARRLADWNYLLRGIMEIWELSRWLGLERELEQLIAEDDDALLCELIGRIGNEWITQQRHFGLLWHSLLEADRVTISQLLSAVGGYSEVPDNGEHLENGVR